MHYPIAMKPRRENQSGFTLIELLVVVVILGVLAALAFPAYTAMMRRAHYAQVKQQMGSMAKDIQMHMVENAQYPADTVTGVKPDAITNWPDTPPLNGTYDYDHWGIGGGQCYVQIGFNSEAGQRKYPLHSANAAPQQFREFEDDLVLGIALYDCPVAQGPVP